ncbi:hypothetical protein ITP53_18860 [Nonomuraea sp. K274]|uniref:Uncharacterized protein n=1 Tax=Nonomuraea cypriaca TaxID=1187855 RepID=A0A931AEG9_9ACTN|nr:hypothetical protein [Nonomuraea cypriaca]MBF8187757.1 hypothetical protein [Nonomuraea cypriaca]
MLGLSTRGRAAPGDGAAGADRRGAGGGRDLAIAGFLLARDAAVYLFLA